VLTLQSGQVQGQVVEGVHRFLGIPYADIPFGEQRFRAPVPRAPWAGVFPADSYGFACPQAELIQPSTLGLGEDCLNLNLWTPDPAAGGLPVMVWVHGGDQDTGSGSLPVYDGSHFARGGVVLVTCNRRLGAEGFLYLEELMGDGVGPGNLGVLDQIEVLRWVQENVSQFGGDPNNITLFGHSSGGAVVQAVVATPAAKGLFHRVIAQSASHAAQRPESANEIGRYVLDRLQVKSGDIQSLQELPWKNFTELSKDINQLGLGYPQAYLPVIGEAMPVHPADAAHSGFGLGLDYLTGTCADEAALLNGPSGAIPSGAIKDDPLFKRVEQVLAVAGVSWAALVETYRFARPDLADHGLDLAIISDIYFRAATMRVAEGHALRSNKRTYTYLCDWKSPLLVGATHGLDLMMFGNGSPLVDVAELATSEPAANFMRRSWVNFAKTGDPSSSAFTWPQYDAEFRHTVAINERPSVLQDPFVAQRKLLGKVMTDNWQLMGL
jgi:para-nitrobenzyl esterase